jgi:hypothetical protein
MLCFVPARPCLYAINPTRPFHLSDKRNKNPCCFIRISCTAQIPAFPSHHRYPEGLINGLGPCPSRSIPQPPEAKAVRVATAAAGSAGSVQASPRDPKGWGSAPALACPTQRLRPSRDPCCGPPRWRRCCQLLPFLPSWSQGYYGASPPRLASHPKPNVLDPS